MERIESPRMDDAGLEHVLAARAVAPRVTLKMVQESIADQEYILRGTLTICILTLHNGFRVVGTSAAASPENFDESIGRTLAHEKAQDQIWPLLGYALKQDLWRASLPQMTQTAPPTDFRDRVRLEHRELNERLGKLEAFIDTEPFERLPEAERGRLRVQSVAMRSYSTVLADRIAAFGE